MSEESARIAGPTNPPAATGLDAEGARAAGALETVLREALRALRALLPYDRSAIHLLENGVLVLRAVDPPILTGPEAARVPVGGGLAGQVAASRAPLYIPDLAGDPRAPRAPSEGISAEARSYLAVPLLHRGTVLGVLQVDARAANAFPEDMRRRLVAFAPAVAAALDEAVGPTELAPGRAAEPRGDLLSLVAHELKAPLTSLRGLALTLAERAETLERGTVEEIARRIARSSERLDRMVTDLLDLSRSERGRLPVELTTVAVGPIVREAGLEPPASHSVTIEVEPGLPEVTADAHRLHQVLQNLLSNAGKFSPQGSPIRIAARRADERVAISVEDRGEGIPREHLDRIFDRFYQVERPSGGPTRGLGIGLSLVREICDAMGAEIEVWSEPGRGSTFTILLPIAAR